MAAVDRGTDQPKVHAEKRVDDLLDVAITDYWTKAGENWKENDAMWYIAFARELSLKHAVLSIQHSSHGGLFEVNNMTCHNE